MDRRLIAGLVGLIVAGCAQAKSAMPPSRQGASGPVGAPEGLAPILDSINRVDRPGDPSARRAALPPELPKPASDGAPASTPPIDATPEIPPGRPAPFADRTEGSPRLQAPPRSGRDEDLPSQARPAPYSDQVPSGPRPQGPPPGPTALAPVGVPPLGEPPSLEKRPMADADVRQASASIPADKPLEDVPIAGASDGQMAKVGDEIITKRQVELLMRERKETIPPEEWAKPDVKLAVFKSILNHLIERSLIVQSAKKKMKEPAALKGFYEAVDKYWMEQELPPMLRSKKVANIHELKVKLAQEGRSLDQIREEFRNEAMAHEFMSMSLQDKMKVSLPEKLNYYNAHLAEFDLPDSLTWREVEISIAKCPSRAEARRRADLVADRLRKGEDFAKVARLESHGATSREGGAWSTGINPSAVPEINQALGTLPTGRISDVVEAPGAFHVVRVEARRAAGPARFDEVQEKVAAKVRLEKQERLFKGFIADIRAKTPVSSILDEPTPDPSAVQAGATR